MSDELLTYFYFQRSSTRQSFASGAVKSVGISFQSFLTCVNIKYKSTWWKHLGNISILCFHVPRLTHSGGDVIQVCL